MSSASATSSTDQRFGGGSAHSDDQDIVISQTCRLYGRLPNGMKTRFLPEETPQFFNDDYENPLIDTQTKRIYKDLKRCSTTSAGALIAEGFATKLAGTRIFTFFLLNSWRLRRQEIKQLRRKLEALQRVALRTHSQTKFFSDLFQKEREHNFELTELLKSASQNLNFMQCSCEHLTQSLISVKENKALLEQELRLKNNEYDALIEVFGRVKKDLCAAIVEQRLLESSLLNECRLVQCIRKQKAKLQNEMDECRQENSRVQTRYHKNLAEKDAEMKRACEKLKFLESEMECMQAKIEQVDDFTQKDLELQKEIQVLHAQVGLLEKSIDSSIDTRVRSIWDLVVRYQRAASQMAQRFAHYLLPATPAPSIPKSSSESSTHESLLCALSNAQCKK